MKHFTDETKLKAVNEVLAGSTRGEVAKKYRVTTTSLNRWKKEFSSSNVPFQETGERKAWLDQVQKVEDQTSEDDVKNLMTKYLSLTRENIRLKEAVVELYLKQCSATKH